MDCTGADCHDEDDTIVFTDTVDGTISLKSYCVGIIDTPFFQRLRGLSQLGVTRFVFPGAVHTRFEHSLGVAYKAHKVARHILKQQGGERAALAEGLGVDMEAIDVKFVTLAGLTHDLGHGPLSHPFDNFVKRRGITNWRHEDMSARILEHLVDNCNLDIERSDLHRITDLIHGMPEEHRRQEGGLWRQGRRFLYDIVANKRNGVDVDKVDYLQRDAAMCGVKVGCDFDRLLKRKFIKVLDDEVCYPWSEYGNILDLFRAREAMHRKVYTNRKCKAVELMAVDALVAADPLLKLSERLDSPEDFISLDDSLLTTIEHYRKNYKGELDDVEEPALVAAQDIVGRIRNRQLYRFGNQFTVPPECLADNRWEAMRRYFTPAEVASCYSGSDLPTGLQAADIICDENKIDHTMGGRNPVERVGFFKQNGSREKFNIGTNQVVGIMPHFFQERVLRVFTPRQEESYVRAIEDALRGWCSKYFGFSAQLATPVRPRRPPGAEADSVPRFALQREVLVNHVADSILQGGVAAAAAAATGAATARPGNGHLASGGGITGGGGSGYGAGAVESTPPRALIGPDATQGPSALGARWGGLGDDEAAGEPGGCGEEPGGREAARTKRQRTVGRGGAA